MTRSSHEFVERLLSRADIQVGGTRPWDIQVHDNRLFARVLGQGSIGLGEAYMDGWWDAPRVDQFIEHLLRARLDVEIKGDWRSILFVLSQIVFNPQTRAKSAEVARVHYDLGNDLYRDMLDPRMVYSCGYWQHAKTLADAQVAKLDLVCRKLDLKPGQQVLDIGCGWGGFAKYAAETYGVQVTGITVSVEQAALAKQMCEGLPVNILIQDYREIKGLYDHIVSIGMFEHVGYKNYRTYMQVTHDHLKDGGYSLLHTIGTNVSTVTTDPWMVKYIFPNSMLPSMAQIARAQEGLFFMEDVHNFGPDYEPTLLAWSKNVESAWSDLSTHYDDRFYRMWQYYLLASAATFRIRDNHVWQIVLAKEGTRPRYQAVR
ncbi:MAG: cyclopropane fatty acyl phospholipid synthase [Candidatus Paceibacterota bacterium]|jgi:cyclopropane-fatty-acyl-phospholipid synthase|nr:cyclopropane fatty acyl phospholipid synthase [Candidatus Paceibacterota bacterium]